MWRKGSQYRELDRVSGQPRNKFGSVAPQDGFKGARTRAAYSGSEIDPESGLSVAINSIQARASATRSSSGMGILSSRDWRIWWTPEVDSARRWTPNPLVGIGAIHTPLYLCFRYFLHQRTLFPRVLRNMSCLRHSPFGRQSMTINYQLCMPPFQLSHQRVDSLGNIGTIRVRALDVCFGTRCGSRDIIVLLRQTTDA
jgi:hypothetical protein